MRLAHARPAMPFVLALAVVLVAGIAAAVRALETDPTAWGTHAILVATGLVVGLSPRWLGSDRRHGEWYAMAPAAAFLTVVPTIGMLIALLRVAAVLPDDALPWRPMVAGLAALTMTVGTLAALREDDVRRLLGWSSVSQVGYGLMAVVAIGHAELARPALVMFVVGHALANVTALAVVVALGRRTDLRACEGLAHHRPAQAITLAVALLSLAGMPPLVGFTAKLALCGAALQAGHAWLAGLAVLNTLVSLHYYFRVLGRMFLAPPRRGVAVLGRPSRATVAIASLVMIAIGVGARIVLEAGTRATLLPG